MAGKEAGPMKTEADRRKSVEIPIAESRIDGLPPPDESEWAIFDAYIRGEIEAKDIVDVIKKRMRLK